MSHGQGILVRNLLNDFRSFKVSDFEILLTLNIPEDQAFISEFYDLPIILIENSQPKGFGLNHNNAFKLSCGEIFIVVNPDIRAPNLDINSLTVLLNEPTSGACAPKVVNSMLIIEDSARRFPTFFRLLARVLLKRRTRDYDFDGSKAIKVDWVAGMFVAFPRAAYAAVGGFDILYFMYMEDADICRRLRQKGYEISVDCSTTVTHDARRASRRSLRHFYWHLRSAARFLFR